MLLRSQPYANHSWHAAGAVLEALQLLSASGPAAAHATYGYYPQEPFHSVREMMEAGPVAWDAFMKRWLSDYDDVWMGSQAVQSLVAIVKLSQAKSPPQATAFWPWLFSYLNKTSDSIGM